MSNQQASQPGESESGLVGDYRFHRDDPWVNHVAGRLPAIRIGWGESRDGEIAHGVSAAERVPCPVLYGRVPQGGCGNGAANSWALAWTQLVKAYIPEHPDLNLGKQFTIWLRFYFAGTATEEQADWPVRLLSRWRSPPDWGYVLWCRQPGIITFTAAVADVHATWSATDPSMRLDTVGWYDVAVAFDGSVLSIYCTAIGSDGPAETAVQRFPTEPGCRPRPRILAAAVNEVGGDLRVMQYGAMLEHLLLYRERALDERQVRELSAGVFIPTACAPSAVEVGTARQLFLDDAVIAERRGLERIWHTAAKDTRNPLLCKGPGDAPDYSGPSSHLSVLYDGTAGVWRLWCHQRRRNSIELFCCQVTSPDGLIWDRPPFDGDVPGGAVRLENAFNECERDLKIVWRDVEEPDPEKRFKAFGYPMDFYTSPDGLVWTNRGQGLYGADDASMAAWLPESRRHFFAIRPLMTGKPPGYRTQAVALSDSPMDNRMPMKLVFTPDESDLAVDPHLQFYHMPVYEYHGWLISPMSVYHSDDGTDGRVEMQWAFSRDGLNWQRPPDRGAAVALGDPGTWDAGSIYAASNLVEADDELRIYYGGTPNRHFESAGSSGIGLARLRRDGFVSLAAAAAEGVVTTAPFRCDGSRLMVNADAGAGSIRVAVLDDVGQPIDGFSMADCRAFQGDAVDHMFSWHGREDLSGLRRTMISLSFELRRASLYAFQIAP